MLMFLSAVDTIGFRIDLQSLYSQVFIYRPCSSYQKDKRAKTGNFPKSSAISKIGERWIQKYFHFLYRQIIAVCSQIHTKHINTLCGQNVEYVSVKPGGTHSDHWALKG